MTEHYSPDPRIDSFVCGNWGIYRKSTIDTSIIHNLLNFLLDSFPGMSILELIQLKEQYHERDHRIYFIVALQMRNSLYACKFYSEHGLLVNKS